MRRVTRLIRRAWATKVSKKNEFSSAGRNPSESGKRSDVQTPGTERSPKPVRRAPSDWSREDNVWIRRKRYEVVRKLGEGGFSRVFEALPISFQDEEEDRAERTPVAIKITRHPGPDESSKESRPRGKSDAFPGVEPKDRSFPGNDDFVKRHLTPGEREKHETAWVELLCHRRANGHPNVVRLLDHAIEPDATALVMEYVPGNVYDRLCSVDGGFSERRVRNYARQLLEALLFVHERGVVHRDVKLENLLLSADGERVVLCDFGLAAFWDPNAKLKERCGSPPYASPEILGWNAGYVGPEVDAWSSGVAIYLMRNGRYPFWSDDPSLLSFVICTQEPVPGLDDVSFELNHLVRCLLAKDSYYRLDVAQAIDHAFFKDVRP